MATLKTVPLFNALSETLMLSLASGLELRQFGAGEEVFRENEDGDSFYIVRKGRVDIRKKSKTLRSLGVNAYFGERALIELQTRSATAVAVEPGT
jgi:CRP-like cAMP-binding protein